VNSGGACGALRKPDGVKQRKDLESPLCALCGRTEEVVLRQEVAPFGLKWFT
jgi:hypothetical protein